MSFIKKSFNFIKDIADKPIDFLSGHEYTGALINLLHRDPTVRGGIHTAIGAAGILQGEKLGDNIGNYVNNIYTKANSIVTKVTAPNYNKDDNDMKIADTNIRLIDNSGNVKYTKVPYTKTSDGEFIYDNKRAKRVSKFDAMIKWNKDDWLNKKYGKPLRQNDLDRYIKKINQSKPGYFKKGNNIDYYKYLQKAEHLLKKHKLSDNDLYSNWVTGTYNSSNIIDFIKKAKKLIKNK